MKYWIRVLDDSGVPLSPAQMHQSYYNHFPYIRSVHLLCIPLFCSSHAFGRSFGEYIWHCNHIITVTFVSFRSNKSNREKNSWPPLSNLGCTADMLKPEDIDKMMRMILVKFVDISAKNEYYKKVECTVVDDTFLEHYQEYRLSSIFIQHSLNFYPNDNFIFKWYLFHLFCSTHFQLISWQFQHVEISFWHR